MDFDLASLETFVRLADCGSFSEVARIQEISQPAVTFRVAKLESVIGLRLFQRHQDGIQLTREGVTLLEHARKILHEHDALGVRMSHFLREAHGRVRVMVDRSEAGDRLVASLKAGPSATELEVIRPSPGQEWDAALREHVVDLVITGSFLLHAADQASIQRYDLERQSGSTLAWNLDYFDFDPARFQFPEVLRSAILVPSDSLVPGYRPFLEKWCLETYGLLPPDIRSFDDEASARDACIAGLGVMIFPGDADQRMNLTQTGLGIVKAFEFLLPDAFSFSIFIRVGERQPLVLQTAMRIGDIHAKQHRAA
ncbi:LysR family transcriptional regulator [Luteolibacter flavescens]|uniref:LysR family transcriptional regulator n=1 Tax=Luteolibacter flavescens TaxID=1859460 RepID=A0ABT3FK32_9BACT|nr:LysR family transcriptional regulator [Luteolibacter flavescens]MCW1883929.1 LysR family transcriptional regulator [Luteolibacter flavescens]